MYGESSSDGSQTDSGRPVSFAAGPLPCWPVAWGWPGCSALSEGVANSRSPARRAAARNTEYRAKRLQTFIHPLYHSAHPWPLRRIAQKLFQKDFNGTEFLFENERLAISRKILFFGRQRAPVGRASRVPGDGSRGAANSAHSANWSGSNPLSIRYRCMLSMGSPGPESRQSITVGP